jgi:hypothetical protein
MKVKFKDLIATVLFAAIAPRQSCAWSFRPNELGGS